MLTFSSFFAKLPASTQRLTPVRRPRSQPIASLPSSPVRIRTHRSSGRTKIFPIVVGKGAADTTVGFREAAASLRAEQAEGVGEGTE